jgi:hypothetical protein
MDNFPRTKRKMIRVTYHFVFEFLFRQAVKAPARALMQFGLGRVLFDGRDNRLDCALTDEHALVLVICSSRISHVLGDLQ